MSDNSSEQEPSIEEILASIRQIISDDDEDTQEEALESPVREKSDDVLELTEDDLAEMEEEPTPEIEPEPEPEEIIEEIEEPEIEMRDRFDEPEEEIVEESYEEPAMPPKSSIPSDILSSSTQSAAIGSISKLASKMPINSARSYDGITLEDIVREMLHPMLREWMDDNLPPMVERIVQKELEKLARRALDD